MMKIHPENFELYWVATIIVASSIFGLWGFILAGALPFFLVTGHLMKDSVMEFLQMILWPILVGACFLIDPIVSVIAFMLWWVLTQSR
jgi:hypothetical protein